MRGRHIERAREVADDLLRRRQRLPFFALVEGRREATRMQEVE
jgi:hypothetical protein